MNKFYKDTKVNFSGDIYNGICFYTDGFYKYTCREEFASSFNSKRQSFYYQFGGVNNLKNTVLLIEKIENYLNLPEDIRATFESTKNPKLLKINAGNWWTANQLRMQLFTAIIKTVACYTTSGGKLIEDIEDILDCGSVYFNTMALKRGFNRFLKGYTDLKSNCDGWVNTLYDDTKLVNMKKVKEKDVNVVV